MKESLELGQVDLGSNPLLAEIFERKHLVKWMKDLNVTVQQRT